MDNNELAKLFHETYERLAPSFGYKTRKESAVSWEQVPEKNKSLMRAVCGEILSRLQGEKSEAERLWACAPKLVKLAIVQRALHAQITPVKLENDPLKVCLECIEKQDLAGLESVLIVGKREHEKTRDDEKSM